MPPGLGRLSSAERKGPILSTYFKALQDALRLPDGTPSKDALVAGYAALLAHDVAVEVDVSTEGRAREANGVARRLVSATWALVAATVVLAIAAVVTAFIMKTTPPEILVMPTLK